MLRGAHPSPGIRRSFGVRRSADAHRYLLTTAAALTPRAAGLVTPVVVLAACAAWRPCQPAMAGPNGGTVVGGSATIQGQGSAAVTFNQASQNAIINWQTSG